MNLLLQILVAAALIALMILARVFVNRHNLRQKLSCEHSDGSCSKTECFHGCGEGGQSKVPE